MIQIFFGFSGLIAGKPAPTGFVLPTRSLWELACQR